MSYKRREFFKEGEIFYPYIELEENRLSNCLTEQNLLFYVFFFKFSFFINLNKLHKC